MTRLLLISFILFIHALLGAVVEVGPAIEDVPNEVSKKRKSTVHQIDDKWIAKKQKTVTTYPELFIAEVNMAIAQSDQEYLLHLLSLDTSFDLTSCYLNAYEVDDYNSALSLAQKRRVNSLARNLAWFYRALQMGVKGLELLSIYLMNDKLEVRHLKAALMSLLHTFVICSFENSKIIHGIVDILYNSKEFKPIADHVINKFQFPQKEEPTYSIILKNLENISSIKSSIPALPELPSLAFYIRSALNGTPFDQLTALINMMEPEKFYSQAIYFIPSLYINVIQDERISEAMKWIPSSSFKYFKQCLSECTPVLPGQVHDEERFWANCLFDNYFHLIEDRRAYEGSVEVEPNDVEYKRLIFPQFNKFYLRHTDSVTDQMVFESDEECKLMSVLRSYLKDLSESSMRFVEKSVQPVQEKLLSLKLGETYALDIFARQSAPGRQGHLIIGLISLSSESSPKSMFYNLRIINTGLDGLLTPGLPHRMNIFTDFLNVPRLKVLGHYLPILPDTKNIYLPHFMKHSDKWSYAAERSRQKYKDGFLPVVDYLHTIRGQRAGSCSIRRIWALAKLTLGLELYMEFKVHFILTFIECLHQRYYEVVHDRWNSPRASIWLRVINMPFLETGLLNQLRRLSPQSPRYTRLRDLILGSVLLRHDLHVYNDLARLHR